MTSRIKIVGVQFAANPDHEPETPMTAQEKPTHHRPPDPIGQDTPSCYYQARTHQCCRQGSSGRQTDESEDRLCAQS